jgi:hypothetical protein
LRWVYLILFTTILLPTRILAYLPFSTALHPARITLKGCGMMPQLGLSASPSSKFFSARELYFGRHSLQLGLTLAGFRHTSAVKTKNVKSTRTTT